MTDEAAHKMDVEVRVLAASIQSNEPKKLHVEWHRNGNSINTAIKDLDLETKKVSFERKEARF